MNRKIVVVNPTLTDDQRGQIEHIVNSYGYQVIFCASNEEALPEMADADACYGLGTSLTRAGKQLDWFHSLSAGVDQYLEEGAIANPSMVLTSSSGTYGVTIAEHVLMVTLELLRREPEYEKTVREHSWKRGLSQRMIKGSRVTILGTGDIGQEIARRIAAFDPEMIIGVNRSGKGKGRLFDRIVKQSRLEQYLPETDILIMCLPGTAETYHIMNQERFALLPEQAVLVNVGRGTCVDQEALAQALKEGKLSAAALDVFESEPLAAEDPLWECPNLLITPHISGDLTTAYTQNRNYEIFCENLISYLQGKPLQNVVDRSAGY